MTIDMQAARDFVYQEGVLWERAMFAYLFQDAPAERVQACLRPYQNPDGGYGNALEHDVRCPDSHPLALEFLLRALADTGLPPGDLLEGVVAWLENNLEEDGSLQNPDAVLDYPRAPWWNEGGQTMPDSIVGNLTVHGLVTPALATSTRRWVAENLTLRKIANNDWLFMAYHAYDYFMNVDDFPDVDQFRAATVANIIKCAENLPRNQYYSFFSFAPGPESPVAQAAPPGLIDGFLDALESDQRDDGGWNDQHDLPQWRPFTTIQVMLALRRFGRLAA